MSDVSILRLHVMRAAYLLLVVGLGLSVVPSVLSHDPLARGVIPSLLTGMWLLAWLGLRYPLAMLPVLLVEFAWKAVWMLGFGLPQYLSGQRPPTFAEDFFAIMLGVVVMPLVIPWGHVWRRYVRASGERWG